MNCAICNNKVCYQGKDCFDFPINIKEKYTEEDNYKLLSTSSKLETEYYMQLTRVEELVQFCKSIGFKRLGMAFCIGLSDEAKIIHDILSKNFEVVSVCCKIGGINKKDYNLPNINEDRYEAICNPIGQAHYLNEAKTDLNIIVGLCLGHDILFSKHSLAPITTLIVKDRVLAHNPVGALYSRYYKKRLGL